MTTALKHLDTMRAKAKEGGGKERIQKQHDKGNTAKHDAEKESEVVVVQQNELPIKKKQAA